MATKDIVGIVIGSIFAVLFFYVLFIKIRERRKIRTSGITVEGVVIELVTRRDSDGTGGDYGYIHYPIVKYLTLEKEWITKEYYIGYNPSIYEEGDAVRIIYDRDEPTKFILDGKVNGIQYNKY